MLCACSGCAVYNRGAAGSLSPSTENGVSFGAFGSMGVPNKSLDETTCFWFHKLKINRRSQPAQVQANLPALAVECGSAATALRRKPAETVCAKRQSSRAERAP